MEQLPIAKLLEQAGIAFRLVQLPENVFTVADVKNNVGDDLKVEEICKTIIIAGKKSGTCQAVFLKGEDKLDFKKAKQLFGEEMAIATAEQVKEASGVEPGAVCPFLVSTALYVDEMVTRLTRVNSGSGHLAYGLEFQLDDLGKVKKYQVVNITKHPD